MAQQFIDRQGEIQFNVPPTGGSPQRRLKINDSIGAARAGWGWVGDEDGFSED
jgi:hypothetical protein